MGVEAAVRQADLFHNVGDARAVVPASPNGARGGPDDPFVGDFLAAWGGPLGCGSTHMMSIIYQSDAERKGSTPGLSVPSDTTSHWSRSNGRSVVSFVVILLQFPVDLRGPTHNTDAQNIA